MPGMRSTAETVWEHQRMIPEPRFILHQTNTELSLQNGQIIKDVSIGDTPKIQLVWLEPDSSSDSKYEYRFRSSYSSSKVSINGGEFVSSSKSGSNLKVVLRVKGVKGTYEAPKEAEWGSGKGRQPGKHQMINRLL